MGLLILKNFIHRIITRVFLILFVLFSKNLIAQKVEIRNINLDRMIWEEINLYRESIGRKPIAYFDSLELRKVSFRLTELNASRAEINHSRGEFRFKGYNTECIAAFSQRTVPIRKLALYDTILTNDEMLLIAKTIVQSWINSNDHNYLIGNKYVKYSTITTITQLDGQSIRVVASYHDICPQPSEFHQYW